MNCKLVALAAMGLLWAPQVLAQGAAQPDAAKGESIVKQTCVACHAADGNSVIPANPKLAGQFQEYLNKQLANFKGQGGMKAERDNPVMAGMVANLSADDLRNVAAYYAAQKLRPATASSKELAAQGQKLWRGGNASNGVPACAGCHGPNGAGIPIQYPRLAGQFAEYLEAQLKLFRAGTRANDVNGMMRGVAAKMTDQEIKAVAEYAAGLR
jgi:cytochrome c553